MITYCIELYDDESLTKPVDGYQYTAKLVHAGSLVKQQALTIVDDHLEMTSEELGLAASVYYFEVWAEKDNQRAIYPDEGMKRLVINPNAQDLPQGTVSSLTLDEFVKQFKQITQGKLDLDDYYNKEQIDNKLANLPQAGIDVEHRTVTINGTTLQVPEAVDLSKLASKDDLQGLVKATELASYAKKTDLPNMSQYATATNVQSLINSMKGQNKAPMIYDLNRTAEDLQNPFDAWTGFNYAHGNAVSIRINDFNQA
ncbi:hypothetical protein FC35_GL000093 [Limosilactobacillus coleohominis DSM 14060]|nr:hypothetical protein FC35_GL000093 [Limosilactobacillus coleohominis DSM 14060]